MPDQTEAEFLGWRLKRQREALGLSLNEVARRSGVAKGHLSTIEHGGRERPGFHVVMRILRVLGNDPWDLVPYSLDEVRLAESGLASETHEPEDQRG